MVLGVYAPAHFGQRLVLVGVFKILHNDLLKCTLEKKGFPLSLYRCLERRAFRQECPP